MQITKNVQFSIKFGTWSSSLFFSFFFFFSRLLLSFLHFRSEVHGTCVKIHDLLTKCTSRQEVPNFTANYYNRRWSNDAEVESQKSSNIEEIVTESKHRQGSYNSRSIALHKKRVVSFDKWCVQRDTTYIWHVYIYMWVWYVLLCDHDVASTEISFLVKLINEIFPAWM